VKCRALDEMARSFRDRRCVELLMRAPLPKLDKAQLPEERDDLARLQDRNPAHRSRHFDGLRPDKHAVEVW
jgi:hypothetical protein